MSLHLSTQGFVSCGNVTVSMIRRTLDLYSSGCGSNFVRISEGKDKEVSMEKRYKKQSKRNRIQSFCLRDIHNLNNIGESLGNIREIDKDDKEGDQRGFLFLMVFGKRESKWPWPGSSVG